jgi:hypothetical protein
MNAEQSVHRCEFANALALADTAEQCRTVARKFLCWWELVAERGASGRRRFLRMVWQREALARAEVLAG